MNRITCFACCLVISIVLNKTHAQKLFQTSYTVLEHLWRGDLLLAKSNDNEIIMATGAVDDDAFHVVYPVLIKVRASDGSVLWAKKYTDDNQNFYIRSLRTAPNGDILISGTFNEKNGLLIPRPFVMLLDEKGTIKWLKLSDDPVYDNKIKAIFLNDNSVVAAYTVEQESFDIVLCKFNALGHVIWSEKVQSHIISPDQVCNDIVKDILPLKNGNIIVLTENDAGSDHKKRCGVVEFDPEGVIVRNVNLTVSGHDISAASVLETGDNGLLISAACWDAITAVKLIDMDSVAWQTNAFNPTNSMNNNYIFGGSGEGSYVFACGDDQHTPENASVRLIRYDSSVFSRSVVITRPGQTLTNGSASPLVIGDDVFVPSISPEMMAVMITKVTKDFDGCKEFAPYFFPAPFPPLQVAAYPVHSIFTSHNFMVLPMPMQQYPLLVDTSIRCERNYFSCRNTLNLGSDTTLCNSHNYQITAPLYSGYRYKWSAGDSSVSIKVNQTGQYMLMAIPPPGFGCDTLYDSVTVTFITLPPVRYSVSEKKLWPGDTVTITCNDTAYDYITWKTGDGSEFKNASFVYAYKKNGLYTIMIDAVKEPCSASVSLQVQVYGFIVFVPDAFTPNGDGVNDVFEPSGAGIDSYTLEIYNRWGALVYKDGKGWNGMADHKPAPGGTYIYLVECRDEKGKPNVRNGTVELIR